MVRNRKTPRNDRVTFVDLASVSGHPDIPPDGPDPVVLGKT